MKKNITKKDEGKPCEVKCSDGLAFGKIAKVKNGICTIADVCFQNLHTKENGNYTMYLEKQDFTRVTIF